MSSTVCLDTNDAGRGVFVHKTFAEIKQTTRDTQEEKQAGEEMEKIHLPL